MAFMMPVVKNDYNIYPSCPSSRAGCGTPQSRGSSLSSSPSGVSSFLSSPRHSHTPAYKSMPKSESQTSLHKFHTRLVEKLRKTFRGKVSSSDDINQASSSGTVIIR
ncbi:uncharacterized protein LOC129981240 [Argiope bruennichi]|uniref:Uncharacterized protein n=1 Tax=Argiope bruennichi TaxID=94029 RepID=A0A8T0FYN0_ARGBR|nr:uncharacterized protein LOC129981240 [Argiope bruennichi]KAF8796217.1 hypothetical protein HNY73_000626 [Argiope bruennichi]